MVSMTPIALTLKNEVGRYVPRLISTFSWVSGANAALPVPVYATVTEYGPPTRMLMMMNRPSARDVVS